MRLSRGTTAVSIIFAALLGCSTVAMAQDAINEPASKTVGAQKDQKPKNKMIPSLAVLSSGGATLKDGKLTMTNIAPNSIVFADRPVRAAGHVLTKDFLKEWDEGPESFAKDPPNATISVLNSDGASIEDAVVVLKKPKMEGTSLTFEVSVLEGNLSKADGPASLFIDWFAAHVGHVGVIAGGPAWHAGWYYHPYPYYHPYYHPYYPPPPPCGYYPYPPCY